VLTAANDYYGQKREKYGKSIMDQVEKAVLLQTLDRLWRDHIVTVDYLRQVIHLRGYGQRDPLNEYKTEAFNLFSALLSQLKQMVTGQMMRIEVQTRAAGEDDMLPDEDELPDMAAHHMDLTSGEDDVGEGAGLALASPPPRNAERKRDPKKPEKRYKHCHGAFV